jgi:high affinity Mn2+ porin
VAGNTSVTTGGAHPAKKNNAVTAALWGMACCIPQGALAEPTDTSTPEIVEIQPWSLHGQSTFVTQYHPGFRSAFRGPNSLDPHEQARETFDLTLYGGFRPWSGAELWINPEIDQGFGLSNTFGVAGYLSGEAYKIGASDPYARLPRVFLRQTINLGGGPANIEAGLNQLAGTQTANRIVLTAGKFSTSSIPINMRMTHATIS